MSETKKATGLALLREPFSANQISVLPKPYKKDSPKGNCSECGGYHGLPAVHLKYVGHAALTDRLLDVDENWNWEPISKNEDGSPKFDKDGGLWIRLTVCGISRLGYGFADGKTGGNAIKETIGDALRNAAMRFGAALDLWHKGDLHGENENDKYVFKAGQHAGVSLEDWSHDQIIAYLNQVNEIKKKPKEVLEIIEMIESYLKEYGP
jgi:hypothetical protein